MHNEKLNKKGRSLIIPLGFYALSPEATVGEIAKKMKKNYSTILRATAELEKKGLVRLSRLERTAKRGKEKRHYTITIRGLETFLLFHDFSRIRDIVDAQSSKLLVFKKWSKFVAAGCEELLIEEIKESLKARVLSDLASLGAVGGVPVSGDDARQGRAFDIFVMRYSYMELPLGHIKELFHKQWADLLKLWRVVEDDYELRRQRDEFLFDREREHTEALESIVEWRGFLKDKAKK